MVIKRIGPLSCARIAGTLYTILGLLFGGAISLVSLAGGFAANGSRGAGLGMVVGVGAIVFLPILYGCFGFVGALIGAWLYNLVAGFVGGIEIAVDTTVA